MKTHKFHLLHPDVSFTFLIQMRKFYLVNLFQIDLKDIGDIYLKKYWESLTLAIKGDTSGDYGKLLVKLATPPVINDKVLLLTDLLTAINSEKFLPTEINTMFNVKTFS
jgi:hypothetical protein